MAKLISSFGKAALSPVRFLAGIPLSDWKWSYWLVIAVQITVVSLILRAWVGPWILRAVLRRVRVRSVSPRSVRGIRIRTKRMTIRLDRLGLSYHSPSLETARRISLQVQGLNIELHEIKRDEPSPDRSQTQRMHTRRFSRRPTLSDFSPSPLWHNFWSLYSYAYELVEPYFRPLVRTFFVTSARVIIRCLPALTHIIDLELERVLITMPGLPESHLTIRSATLSTTVSFSGLESVIDVNAQEPQTVRVRRRFLGMGHFRTRFGGSVRRVWDRAWGRTQGAAVFELKVGRIAAYADEACWVYPQVARFQEAESSSQFSASRFDFVTSSLHDDVTCISVPDTTTFKSSFKFGPKQGIVEKQSVELSLSISRVHVGLDALLKLRSVLKDNFGRTVGQARRRQDSTSLPSPMSPTSTEPIFIPELPSERVRKRLRDNSITEYMRSCKFHVKNVTVQFRPWYENSDSGQLHTAYSKDLQWSLSLSDPTTNDLQLKYIGRTAKEDSSNVGPVYSMLLSIREITLQRYEDADEQTFLRVISIGRVKVECLASQWPVTSLSRKSQGDPNDSLLIILLDISAPQFCERLDVLASMLNSLNSQPPSKASPPRRVLNFVPRLILGLSVRDIAACFIPTSQESTSILVSSTQATFSFSTFFKPLPLGRPNFAESCSCGYIPIELQGEGHAILGPAFMTYLSHRFDLDESDRVSKYVESPSTFGEPLVSLGTLDMKLTTGMLGGVFGELETVSLDLGSTMMDVSLASDAVSIELWQPTAVAGLVDLLQFLTSLKSARESSVHNDSTQQSTDLGASISLYFAVGQLGVVITSKDLNPDEDLGISRGIALQTGLSVHCCSFKGRGHFARLRRQFSLAHARQRLDLPEDLTTEAIAQANAQSLDDGRLTLVRVKSWNTSVRTTVATEYAMDLDYNDTKDKDELRATEFIWMDRLQLDVMTKREKRIEGHLRKRTQFELRAPYLESRLRLVHIYCSLLASATLQRLLKVHGPTPAPKTRDSDEIVIFKASVDTIQALIHFPLQEQLCFRVNSLSSRVSSKEPFTLAWGMLFLWIPSRKLLGTWEEIGRLKSWKATVSDGQLLSVNVEGDGASIRIPSNSIFADLILDISVTFKACRHMHHVISSKKFHPLPVPGPEDAKMVPDISVKVACIMVEAADDTLEAKLGLSWRCGLEATKTRQERDEAFEAKVSAIYSAENISSTMGPETRFSAQHSVSVEDARERLLQVHAISWVSLHQEYKEKQRKKEDRTRRRLRGDYSLYSGVDVPPLVNVLLPSRAPPLFRVTMNNVALSMSRPRFEGGDLSEYLFDLGKGLPRNTLFTLLIPMHLNVATSSATVTLRDYPLPLLSIPRKKNSVALVIDTDVVIAEEIGTLSSVQWKECLVVPAGFGSPGTPAFSFTVPKTSMPVKSYADPSVDVMATGVTEFCWGVSYGPALQDVMHVLDTLTTPPPDPSPVLGFWDKMRLVLHWRVRVSFKNEVHLNLKGSRNPHHVTGNGAGFAFCWNGNTEMLINYENSGDELLQLTSDTMLIVIPDFSLRGSDESDEEITDEDQGRKRYKKICANFTSGIRWGIGFILERTCDEVCPTCHGAFSCRHFSFRPHYEVQLEPKDAIPREKSVDDSFNGFRSDFIHLSTSLTSRMGIDESSAKTGPSSFYLTPKTFSHFWSWWDLFDRFLSLPVRQGSQFPNARPPSRKFGQHLATIKYRISVPQLFISHLYVDDTFESWRDGVTNFIGIKALVDLFEADMHQREQEATVPGTSKKIRHKPFYAAEVKLMGLHLRAIMATFFDPLKQDVAIEMAADQGDGSFLNDSYVGDDPPRNWVDMCDFVELDCAPNDSKPSLSMLPIASCPRFSYFRRSSGQAQGGDLRGVASERSRFGDENTHVCLLGKEPSLHQIQTDLVAARIATLKSDLARTNGVHLPESAQFSSSGHDSTDRIASDIIKKIKQLEQYAAQLHDTDDQDHPALEPSASFSTYLLPSDIDCPADWTEFDNVYQFHQLNVFLANTTRNILMRYYHCSRSRRGFEYHMATRAVRFIRDQANALFPELDDIRDKKQKKPANSAQVAAHALKKMLVGDDDATFRARSSEESKPFDPLDGWSDGVAVRKGHFCLLLKPQIVLRCEASKDAVCVLAALQATLQSFAILDTANAEDPVSGRIMTRTHAVLTGLQSFAPSPKCNITSDGVPLEVLIDLRADSEDFDRLVPQTNAIFRYDKFNRLRVRSNLTNTLVGPTNKANDHLQHQMDLIDVQVPRFSVTAGSRNFQAISTIITKLLLFSDAMHKQRASAVETLLFKYDFTNLSSAASVVEGFQARLRRAVEREQVLGNHLAYEEEPTQIDVLRTKAHVLLLSNELGLIFDAIKLAQDKLDEKNADQKSALKLHASSTEISWGMVDDIRNLLVKLAVRGIDFSWLSRHDGSTVNKLHITDLQAFDGSRDAEWPEIISKYKDPSSHPLVKRGVFAEADWTVLAPVGGIAIFENFLLQLHPMRLQLESRVGKVIMEYVFPGRRERKKAHRQDLTDHTDPPETPPSARSSSHLFHNALVTQSDPSMLQRSSAESPRTPSGRYSIEERRATLSANSSKRMVAARSFSDLRQASRQNSSQRVDEVSPYLLVDKPSSAFDFNGHGTGRAVPQLDLTPVQKAQDDAAEMKTRASQNTFVLVKISSMHLLLSFRKDGSFFCRDARIRTRELVIRNQTWSFEELANQFIPSDPTWRGWMKVALHQPLVPVLPVAKELFSKTKWIASKGRRKSEKLEENEILVSNSSAASSSVRIQSPPKVNIFRHLKKSSSDSKAGSSKDSEKTSLD